MTNKITIEYIGKERIFTNNSAFENNENLEKMTEKLTEITQDPNAHMKDIYMAMGEYVATIFENFEPNEMLKADELEVYLVRGLNTIKNLYKMGKSKKEIDKVKNQIIEKAIEDEVFRL